MCKDSLRCFAYNILCKITEFRSEDMIKLLLKFFVDKNSNESERRVKYSVFAGTLGIICNLLLFAVKVGVGTAMSSIAIISDAFNNLSDTGSSMVSIIGVKLSAKEPDREHPFGHGRLEYISSLIVAFIIMLVGFELFKSSAAKIFNPEAVALSPVLLVILCISIPVKLWMYSYNKYVGKITGSGVILATAKDSINDVIATSAVILSAIIGKLINFPPLDGIVGTVVSLLILYSGLRIALDTIDILLGAPPEKELIEAIRSRVLEAEGVVGVHDLIVHDYGPGRVLASVHAEVPDDCNVVEIHEVIDLLEQKIDKELGVHIVVHMDPIAVNSEYINSIRNKVVAIVKEIDERLNIHDFRMTDGSNLINLIFDIEIPLDFNYTEEIENRIKARLKEEDERFNTVIGIDYIYD